MTGFYSCLYGREFGNKFRSLILRFIVEKDKTSLKVLEIDPPISSNELSEILNQNSLYYSQQIWLNSDVHFLTLQLSQYSFKGEPIVESIDPKPVAVAGNCLGFIWHNQEDKEWLDWVQDNINLERVTTQKTALPTDGVFGEAVLGRFNSAEKLDITRFWNWQDSPIPINAPDIAAIQAGQHQVSQPQQPGNLDTPIVNIMNPPALPDPTGMQGILQALIASNMFRDMSGISQAAALANTTTNASTQGAIALGQQVGSNLNAQVDLAKTFAQLIPLLFGLPPLGAIPGGKNISTAGAAFNAAQNLDSKSGGQQNSQEPNPIPLPLIPSNGSSNGNSGIIAASTRGETGNVMDMITGGGTLRGIPVDLVRNAITGQVSSTQNDKKIPQNIIDNAIAVKKQIKQVVDAINTKVDFAGEILLVNFPIADFTLSDSQKIILDDFINIQKVNNKFEITLIEGHASQTGPEKHLPGGIFPGNLALSEMRAVEVRNYLLNGGLPQNVIKEEKGVGSSSPIVDLGKGIEVDENRSVLIKYKYSLSNIVIDPSLSELESFNCGPTTSRNWSITPILSSKLFDLLSKENRKDLKNLFDTLATDPKKSPIVSKGVTFPSYLFKVTNDNTNESRIFAFSGAGFNIGLGAELSTGSSISVVTSPQTFITAQCLDFSDFTTPAIFVEVGATLANFNYSPSGNVVLLDPAIGATIDTGGLDLVPGLGIKVDATATIGLFYEIPFLKY